MFNFDKKVCRKFCVACQKDRKHENEDCLVCKGKQADLLLNYRLSLGTDNLSSEVAE
jgi:hypothetical protein